MIERFADSVAFLYAPGGRQTDVIPGAIDPRRVSVVRGRVVDSVGDGLADVEVTVLGATETAHAKRR